MTTRGVIPTISEEQIARRAYEIWEACGCPDGDGAENWQAAIAELQEEAGHSLTATSHTEGRGFISRCLGRLRKAG